MRSSSKGSLIVDGAILFVAFLVSAVLLFDHHVATQVTIDTREKPYVRAVDPSVDLIFGNPNADLFIVEYGDLECPYCREFHPNIKTLIQSEWGRSGRVAWVWRDGFHINTTSIEKAKTLACIRLHGGSTARQKAWHFIEDSLTGGVEERLYPFERYKEIIENLALPFERIEQCRRDDEVADSITLAKKEVAELGITETPRLHFILKNGELVFDTVGALTTSQLETFVVSILQNSQTTR